MTVFYSIRTGEIKGYTTGETDLGYFGEDEGDFSLIYDYLVTSLNNYVLDNFKQFHVVDKEIKLKAGLKLEQYL